MKTKPIPIAIALAAGFITCIISFLNQVTMAHFVRNFALTIVVFYILGSVVRFLLDRFIPLETEEETSEEAKEEEEKEQTAEEEAGQEEKTEEAENMNEEEQS